MSIKVLDHGRRIIVTNPVTQKKTRMINVRFIEEGRTGGNAKLSLTSDFLSQITGEKNVGLNNVRLHTQPVPEEKIGLFPIGKEFPGHINRGLFSTPQLEQQTNVPPRMIDGKPTYFVTWMSQVAEDDVDERMTNEALVQLNPSSFVNAITRATVVEEVEEEPSSPQVRVGDTA